MVNAKSPDGLDPTYLAFEGELLSNPQTNMSKYINTYLYSIANVLYENKSVLQILRVLPVD